MNFSDPIYFQVAVSRQAQKEFSGETDFPSGNYYVAWDGVFLLVMWEQQSDKRVSRAAGRVVAEILTEAAEKCAADVYVQACSPGCQNLFTHTDALHVKSSDQHRTTGHGLLVVDHDELQSIDDELASWYRRAHYYFWLFAEYKNNARRIRDLSSITNSRLSSMLAMRQKHHSIPVLKWREQMRRRLAMRGWRKKSRKAMGDVWLSVAAIEVMRQSWDEDRRRFKDRIRDNPIEPLFQYDYSDDEAAIDAIDSTLAREALADASSRFDTRVIAVVTAASGVSALVGAIAGGLVGAA
ncbi:hypothetical protein [Nocardioides aquaticus]|nr:hypothetical protein [Nocardioides aquaticus]